MSSGKWNTGEDRKEQLLLQKADKQEELRIKKEFLATQRKQEQEQVSYIGELADRGNV